jgi:hypothetical protein
MDLFEFLFRLHRLSVPSPAFPSRPFASFASVVGHALGVFPIRNVYLAGICVLLGMGKIIPELLHVRQPSPIMLGLGPPLTLTARRVHLMPSLIIFPRRSHSALPHCSAHNNREIDQ